MGDIYHAGEVYAGSVPIDDTQASEHTVYSSAKVETMIGEVLDGDITYLNTLKYNVNILSYTQANPYTAPSDGYVLAAGNNSGTGSIVLAGSSLRVTVPAGGYSSIFVKKGLTIYGESLYAMAFKAFNRA